MNPVMRDAESLSPEHENPNTSWIELACEEEEAYTLGADEYDRLRSVWEHETGEVL